ncbi:MAG: siderophore biosynthesis protein [Verrucomicrobiales bacterium]|nr:siderophore biosynthesis protein [Verrucomicrobiales bacterium]
MKYSLFFFDGDGATAGEGHYRLLLDSAKFADENGMTAVWTPERHFHAFGGLYPNPALTGAALATTTKNIQVRAGSCVLPLHHPVRVAEDWAVIDNLSNGRAGMAVASGWTMDEFILSRDPHGSRRTVMWKNLDMIQRLWRGEGVTFEDANGREVEAKTLPGPLQPELPVWITCQSTESFIEAGRTGANVLTSLLGGTLEEAAGKIAKYRAAWDKQGHEKAAGTVSLMAHTFLGADEDKVKQEIREPFGAYLKTHYGLLENLAKGMGLEVSLNDFSDDDLDAILNFGIDGFIKQRSLIGTPSGCASLVKEFADAGVDELCCLIDFVQDYDAVMGALPFLKELMTATET